MTRSTPYGLWTHRYRIEREVDEVRRAIGIEEEIAAFNDIDLARHCFEYACELYPDRRLYLMQGARVMIQHPDTPPEPLKPWSEKYGKGGKRG